MWLAALIGAGVGLLLGAAGAAAWLIGRLSQARTRAALLETQAQKAVDELRVAHGQREAAERQAAAMQATLEAERRNLAEQKRLLAEAEKKLTDTFTALGAAALKSNNEQFMQLASQHLAPFKELLEKHNKAVGEIETKREAAYAAIETQIKAIAGAHGELRSETARLVTALRRPEQRGRWGEVQLRNCVELAGMAEHCDFVEQESVRGEEGLLRPDMLVRLPGGGVIPVDAKAALDAYLNALEPGADREAGLRRHAEQVQTHVRKLAEKRYWEQFERAPGVVVMFMPLESALVAALETQPDLHAQAMERRVLIATPTLLVAMLRAIAFGWQQEAIAANARQIADEGRALYERLATFAGHLTDLGRALERGSRAYNSAVGSLERMVLPSARKLRELKATAGDEIADPPLIETEIRSVAAEELTSLRRDDGRPRDGAGLA